MGINTNYKDVQDFHRKFGISPRMQPGLLAPDIEEFRIKFMQEELDEYASATSVQKKADALVDLVYVALGTGDMMGLPWDALWDAVQRANMRKERARSAEHSAESTGRGHSLDVVKPDGWVSPDYEQAEALHMAAVLGIGAAVERPTLNETMLRVAVALSLRATCAKRRVGCVLTDSRGRIIGTGYNGTPCDMDHCSSSLQEWRDGKKPHQCAGAGAPKGSDLCEAVHAETNALLQCRQPDAIHTVYVTCSPCQRCTKELLNTPAARVVFLEHSGETQAEDLWLRTGRQWVQHV